MFTALCNCFSYLSIMANESEVRENSFTKNSLLKLYNATLLTYLKNQFVILKCIVQMVKLKITQGLNV